MSDTRSHIADLDNDGPLPAQGVRDAGLVVHIRPRLPTNLTLILPVHGILAAQLIKPQARVLANDRGISCVAVD